MKITPTRLPDVLLVEPQRFGDQRGYFMETYQRRRYAEAGIGATFVQDNISFSRRNTLRGLHYQHPGGQAKLVQVLTGEIFDVAVDVRRGAPTFGQWVGVTLNADRPQQLFIPAGFAHGFCVLSDTALFLYKCTTYYAPQNEGGVVWNDPDLDIRWPIDAPLLSDRDRDFPPLAQVAADRLPVYGE